MSGIDQLYDREEELRSLLFEAEEDAELLRFELASAENLQTSGYSSNDPYAEAEIATLRKLFKAAQRNVERLQDELERLTEEIWRADYNGYLAGIDA